MWKASVEGKLSLEDDENENPKDVDNDETEVNDKDCCIKLFDQIYDYKDRIDVKCNQTHEKKKKTPDFESLTVDDRKEDSNNVEGYQNVDKELSKWIRVISPSAHDEKTQVFQTMEDDEEPELSLLVVPVDLPAGEEGEGEPEGGDEVQPPLQVQPLSQRARTRLGRVEDAV